MLHTQASGDHLLDSMPVKDDTSQLSMVVERAGELRNISYMLVTEDTSQLLMSCSNAIAELNTAMVVVVV